MKKSLKQKSHSMPSRDNSGIADLIRIVQQQLTFLDKKIDTMIERFSERPFAGKEHSKPFQSFSQHNRQGEARQNNNYRERILHKAICADCNKECEVPFRPSQDRPVYCKECFSKRKAGGSSNEKRYDKFREERTIEKKPFLKKRKKARK